MPTPTANTKTSDLGTNRTGVQASPFDSKEMAENTGAVAADPNGARAIATERASLSKNAPPVGTMPPPAKLKGMAKTAVKVLKGEKPTVFLDKLGERLAFERTGVRLYEAVIAKVPAASTAEGTLTLGALSRHRDEELAHMHLVKEAIEEMGADPSAMTPSADLKGVEAMGLIQAVTDPRTTLTQCLDVLLTAELADNDGWRLLIALAETSGHQELAQRFAQAHAEEDQHLSAVRRWVSERLSIQLGKDVPAPDWGHPAAT